MKLTTKGRYAARAMLELAQNSGTGPIQIKIIARKQGISIKYLERIMSRMAAAGLVNSLRGMHGGFTLARPPQEISLLEILTAADESILPVKCITDPRPCNAAQGCIMNRVWTGLYQHMKTYLDSITLKDMMDMDESHPRPDWRDP